MPRPKGPAMRSKEYYQEEYINKKRSPHEIAEEFGTYPNKIRRELQSYGFVLRGSSEAQSQALKSGRRKHPTEGQTRSEETKQNISRGNAGAWKKIDDKEREKRSKRGKEYWASLSESDKEEFQKAGLNAIRKTSKEGSKLEKFLMEGLTDQGFRPTYHVEHNLPGTKMHTDLFIASLKTAIEVDGPSHYLPIWGEERFRKTKEYDQNKNDALISYGYVLIRVQQTTQSVSDYQSRELLSQLIDKLREIEKEFPSKQNRLIYIKGE